MTVFRRRKRDGSDESFDDATANELDAQTEAAPNRIAQNAADGTGSADAPPVAAAEPGPWDSEAPPADDQRRLDLGGLLVPVPDGVEVRVDVDPEGRVIAATVVLGSSAMQLSAFATPRTEGIWAEVRAEIVDSLRATGGSAEEVGGPFGVELRAQVSAAPSPAPPGQSPPLQPARFIGVDGPRWFVRGLVTGSAAVDHDAAVALEAVLRGVVVHRGKEAMAPRDPLPLRLPQELLAAAEAERDNAGQDNAGQDNAGQQARQGDDFNPFERGPEITEIQ